MPLRTQNLPFKASLWNRLVVAFRLVVYSELIIGWYE